VCSGHSSSCLHHHFLCLWNATPLVEASTVVLRYATDTLKYITSYILYQTMVIEIWRIAQTNIKHRFREKYRPKVKYIDIHMHV
jgi:hypothetical protein